MKRLALIAGEGDLVEQAISIAGERNIDLHLFDLTGERASATRVTQVRAGKPIDLAFKLRRAKPSHICMVGRVSISDGERGALLNAISWVGRLFGSRNATSSTGDAGLSGAVPLLERLTGAKVIGVHELVEGLAVSERLLAGPKLSADQLDLADRALLAAREAGALDLGQAVIVAGRRIVAIEDIAGTDALLERVAYLREQGYLNAGAAQTVLAKAMKPNQPTSVDLPTIGAQTVKLAHKVGVGIICVQADCTLLAEGSKTVQLANELGVSIIARKIEAPANA